MLACLALLSRRLPQRQKVRAPRVHYWRTSDVEFYICGVLLEQDMQLLSLSSLTNLAVIRVVGPMHYAFPGAGVVVSNTWVPGR